MHFITLPGLDHTHTVNPDHVTCLEAREPEGTDVHLDDGTCLRVRTPLSTTRRLLESTA